MFCYSDIFCVADMFCYPDIFCVADMFCCSDMFCVADMFCRSDCNLSLFSIAFMFFILNVVYTINL